jgi:hypothetical protein
VTHQPVISFSISLQHLFNRAGGRTSNVSEKMKITSKARLITLFMVIGMICWTLGYVQGNAGGSRRIATTCLIMHSSTLKRFQDGDVNAARLYATIGVRAGDKYLHSKPFWWTALKEVFTVDNEELFDEQLPLARERVEWSSNAPKIQVEGKSSER